MKLYVLAAFNRNQVKSIKYANSNNPETISKWVQQLLKKDADVISIRRVETKLEV